MMTVKTIGGDKLLNKFKKMGDEAEERFKELVDKTAVYIQGKAVGYIGQNVKTGSGHLKQSMYVDLTGADFAIVGNRAAYAGYVEFGTGKKVSIPPEFTEIAQRIRSRPSKSFDQGLVAMQDWCKMNGIDESLAWVIFMSILGKRGKPAGVRARPFLYPAYRDGRRYMGQEAAKAIKRLTKK